VTIAPVVGKRWEKKMTTLWTMMKKQIKSIVQNVKKGIKKKWESEGKTIIKLPMLL